MTNEEAIKMLKTEKACVERQERKQNCNRYCESCDLCMPIEDVIEGYNMAIKALEQTDGDLISRKDLLKDIADLKKSLWFNDGKYNKDLFRRNSYVARKEAIEIIEDLCIKKLPSAEKTAEWIFWTSKSAKCSNCGHIQFTNGEDTTKNTLIHKALYHYCPMCGAKMKG